MHSAIATEPGSPKSSNCDYAGATPTAVVVIDGLTVPAGLETGCVHGVPWYVRTLTSTLLGQFASDPPYDLRSAVEEAISKTANAHGGTCDLRNPATPSAALGLLVEDRETVRYLVLADVTVVLDGDLGLTDICDRRVEEVAQVEAAAAANATESERSQRVSELVAAQLGVRNVPGGYWIAGSNPEAAWHGVVGESERAQVRRAALLSDGASRFVDTFSLGGWSSALDLMAHSGPAALIQAVRYAELRDLDRRLAPRFKSSDDATAVFVTWTEANGERGQLC